MVTHKRKVPFQKVKKQGLSPCFSSSLFTLFGPLSHLLLTLLSFILSRPKGPFPVWHSIKERGSSLDMPLVVERWNCEKLRACSLFKAQKVCEAEKVWFSH